MHIYHHKVHYYETDKMRITHHSNYIRWMEEARMDYLSSLGYGMKRLESEGITSPVVSVTCQYKQPTTFDDIIEIEVSLLRYTGVKLILQYVMKNTATQAVVCTAESSHCLIDTAGKPISVKKRFPAFDAVLREQIKE